MIIDRTAEPKRTRDEAWEDPDLEVSVADVDDIPHLTTEEVASELIEEDDDNAYQNSDEVLPDDGEERVIERDPSKEGGRFDEV